MYKKRYDMWCECVVVCEWIVNEIKLLFEQLKFFEL